MVAVRRLLLAGLALAGCDGDDERFAEWSACVDRCVAASVQQQQSMRCDESCGIVPLPEHPCALWASTAEHLATRLRESTCEGTPEGLPAVDSPCEVSRRLLERRAACVNEGL